MSNENATRTVVVIGGGIAGTSCVEALFQDYNESKPQYKRIVLISESRLVKRIVNYELRGRQLERFDVSEDEIDALVASTPNNLQFEFIVGSVLCLYPTEKFVVYATSQKGDNIIELKLNYDILCLCNGSKPRHLSCMERIGTSAEVAKRVILIRDTITVLELGIKLKNCRRLAIVGNGGISLELISKVSDCEKVWIIRDHSIGYTFFDSGAAKFLLDASTCDKNFKPTNQKSQISFAASTTVNNSAGQQTTTTSQFGPALGPNWSQNVELSGKCLSSHKLDIIYHDEVQDILYADNQPYPLKIITKNKKEIDCDLVVSAIGVEPNTMQVAGGFLETSPSDNGILVDNQMRTSLKDVYAAGDVVSCDRWAHSNLWFQMRLWTQARQMGYYAGRCIATHLSGEDPSIYFNFECFSHSTTFFGYKLVLLGIFNGQSLNQMGDCERFEVVARVNSGKDYVKVLIGDDGRILGAVLVGDSGLEETIENLIHDRIDVSAYKDQLLDGTVDIEDYFD